MDLSRIELLSPQRAPLKNHNPLLLWMHLELGLLKIFIRWT